MQHTIETDFIQNKMVFDTLIEIADKLSDDAYIRYCNGDIDETEMRSCFHKIETWAQLTNELSQVYERNYAGF